MTAVDHAELGSDLGYWEMEAGRLHEGRKLASEFSEVEWGFLKRALTQSLALLSEIEGLNRHRDRLAKTAQSRLDDWHEAQRETDAIRTQAPDSWRPMETAPKDGTWVQAWRDPPGFSGPRWEPLIYVRWDDAEESWIWPCDMFEVFTVRGRELADMEIDEDAFYSSPDFTHWMPLPAAPALRPQTAEERGMTDLLTRLWTANAPQARAVWKEAKERGVHDELKRAFGFYRKGEV